MPIVLAGGDRTLGLGRGLVKPQSSSAIRDESCSGWYNVHELTVAQRFMNPNSSEPVSGAHVVAFHGERGLPRAVARPSIPSV